MQLRYVEQALSMELDGVASARKFVRDLVSQLDTSTAYRVELLTSELATNALLHGRSAFDIVVLEAGGRLRVEVATTVLRTRCS